MITSIELSKMTTQELRDLNKQVVEMLRLKVQIDGKINAQTLRVGMTVKYTGKSTKATSEIFELMKINKVNAVCKSKSTGRLYNIKLAALKESI